MKKPARSLLIAYIAIFHLALPPGPSALHAQERRDTVVHRLRGFIVEAARPSIVGGGASAVEVLLDSLEQRASPTLAETLRQLPLVRVRQNSRGEAQPSLRGMEEREIAVLVDGVPLTVGWDNRTDLSVVPLAGATRLTIVRGLSSVLAGPNALGGVLEVGMATAHLPRQAPPPFRIRTGIEHTGAVSLAGEASRLWANAEHDRGFLLRYGAGYRTSEGVALARGLPSAAEDDGRLLNSDREYLNGFVSGRWESGPGKSWLGFSSTAYRAERGVVPETHLLGGDEPAPRFWRIPNQWRSVTSISAGSGWLNSRLGEGDVEVSLGLDFQRLEIDGYDSPAYADSVDGETGIDRTLSLRVVADHTLGPGVLRGAMTFTQTRHEQILGNEPTEVYGQRLWSFGLESEQPILPGRSLGGQLSHPTITFGFSADGFSNPETGSWPSQPGRWGWGTRIAGEAEFWDGRGTIHGGVSRKIRFPALREMFSGALGKFLPNPELEPITLKVAEVGTTLTPMDGLEVQGILFSQRLEGAIVRAVVEGGLFQRQNRGETRANGVELLANWRWEEFALRGDITLQRVRLLDTEGGDTSEEPEYQPEISASLSGEAPLVLGLRGRAGIEYLGEQFGVNPRTDTFDVLGATTYLEAGVSRYFQDVGKLPLLRASVVVENLTDQAIYDQLGLPRPGRTLRFLLEVL